MASTDNETDIRSYFFYAHWCGPCKRIKPFIEKLSYIYSMNGITCSEYDYDLSNTKILMDKLNVQTVPTLVVYSVPSDNEWEDITDAVEIYRGDSKEIPLTSLNIVNTFSIDEDF